MRDKAASKAHLEGLNFTCTELNGKAGPNIKIPYAILTKKNIKKEKAYSIE